MSDIHHLARPASRIGAQRIWWADPAKLTAYFIIPALAFIGWDLLNSSRLAEAGIPTYFTASHLILCAAILAVVSASSYIGQRLRVFSSIAQRHTQISEPFIILIGLLSSVASFIYLSPVTLNPSNLIGFALGEVSPYQLKASATNIAGLTTLSHAGAFFVSVYFADLSSGRPFRNRALLKALFFLVLLFGLLQAFAFSERLAFLEVFIPVALIHVVMNHRRRGRLFNSIVRTLPYLGIILLYVTFTVFEYFRSWTWHYSMTSDNLWEFGHNRLVLYYSTALNNGAIHLQYGNDVLLAASLDWLYKLPIIGNYLSPDSTVGAGTLYRYASEEFNNPSGILLYYKDWGFWILPVTALFGLVMGGLYRIFLNGNHAASWLYPTMYIGLLEILRIPYITSGRFFPVILCFALAIVFFCRTRAEASRKNDLLHYFPTHRLASSRHYARLRNGPSF